MCLLKPPVLSLVHRPLLNHTASDRKLGERLGTRLARFYVLLLSWLFDLTQCLYVYMLALNVCTIQLYLTTDKWLELYTCEHSYSQSSQSTGDIFNCLCFIGNVFISSVLCFFLIRFVSLRSFKFVSV